MLFNSIEFAVFLPLVFVLYWFVTNKKLKTQNVLLLFASYVFYGWWDWRFLSLIIFSSFVDYFIGLSISKTNNINRKKVLLYTSIFINLGFLGFFKYFNFFAESFSDAFTLLGSHVSPTRLNIILPVGISFYTFQTLSYTIDVYKGKIKATKNIIAFFAFVSFFPQLVAGPIERAANLLPQFYRKRSFDYNRAVGGMRQILWGLFKKVVIADNCAEYANIIFDDSGAYSGSTLALGALFFTFQIYGDFSGYSDIAIGVSKLFGFDLMKNFAFPYFSRDIAEFWRRWHISLSTWFRDYLYIPLGGSKGGIWMKVRNTFIIFIVSGFWHGANWTFVVWGFLNALYFLPLLLTNKNRQHINHVSSSSFFPSFKEITSIAITFSLTVFAWIFFRAVSIKHALGYIDGMLSKSLFSIPGIHPTDLMVIITLFMIIEWWQRKNNFVFENLSINTSKPVRWFIYVMVALCIFVYQGKQQEFIYFQF